MTSNIVVSSDRAICSRCGASYSGLKEAFPVSYAPQYKGLGHIPICRKCINHMYNEYFAQCRNNKSAVRQMCRKLDLYWNEDIFNNVMLRSTSNTVMLRYIQKTATVTYAGKCYDDTLIEEETLWDFPDTEKPKVEEPVKEEPIDVEEHDEEDIDIPQEVIDFWGAGFSKKMYKELEQRREYYMSQLPKDEVLDIGSEVLIRQLCNLEVSIAHDSAAGKSIEKSVNALNTLLGSLNLKPAQKKNDTEEQELSSTPLGVWLYRYENKRPLPDVNENLKDKNHIKKYIFTWMGHLGHMLGIKGAYTKLYDEEISRLKVERPEFADEDDEDLLIDSYSKPYTDTGQDGDSP